jgi:hypothetical protein
VISQCPLVAHALVVCSTKSCWRRIMSSCKITCVQYIWNGGSGSFLDPC